VRRVAKLRASSIVAVDASGSSLLLITVSYTAREKRVCICRRKWLATDCAYPVPSVSTTSESR
jgi:hypothetical protein